MGNEGGLTRRAFLQLAGAGAAALGLAGRLGAGMAGPGSGLPTRTLGRTGVRVSVLGLGTAALGGRPDEEAIRLLRAAVDLGVTYIDTAPAHGGYGRAQLQIGEALHDRRSEIFLVTKCFVPDGAGALRDLERSLKELRTDRADLVLAHSIGANEMPPGVVFSPAGVLSALRRMQEEGLARFVGISGHNRPERFVRALREFDLDVMMTAVNFADVNTYNFEGVAWPLARERGAGLVAMKVFGGVRRGAANVPRERHDLAFRYALSLEGCATAVIGMLSDAELRQNVERARRFSPLSAEELGSLSGPGRELARHWGAHFGPVE